MNSLERVPRSGDGGGPVIPQEILEALARQLRQRLGDPNERLSVCCEDELDRELCKFLRDLDKDDVAILRGLMGMMKGHKLRERDDVPDALKDIEHMLADYRSARSIGKILRVVWVGLGVACGAVFAIIKGLPDFLEILRGWLK